MASFLTPIRHACRKILPFAFCGNIYISVLRVQLLPPLVAITIETTPILEVMQNMTRCHQVTAIGHTLSANH
jgi:hypothetical protein